MESTLHLRSFMSQEFKLHKWLNTLHVLDFIQSNNQVLLLFKHLTLSIIKIQAEKNPSVIHSYLRHCFITVNVSFENHLLSVTKHLLSNKIQKQKKHWVKNPIKLTNLNGFIASINNNESVHLIMLNDINSCISINSITLINGSSSTL